MNKLTEKTTISVGLLWGLSAVLVSVVIWGVKLQAQAQTNTHDIETLQQDQKDRDNFIRELQNTAVKLETNVDTLSRVVERLDTTIK